MPRNAPRRPAPDRSPQLEEGERHLRDFLKHANYLIQSTSMDGRLLFVNETWQRVMGYNDADVAAGLALFDLLAPEAREAGEASFRRVTADAESTTEGASASEGRELELLLVTREGRRVLVAGEADCRIVDGQPVATRAIFRDVTRQRAAEAHARQVEARHEAVVSVLGEGIAIVTRDGVVELANASAERILGVRADGVVGRRMLDWPWRMFDEDGGELPREAHPIFVALHTGRAQADTVLGVRRGDTGERIWVAVNAHPLVRPGETRPHAAVASFRDVTERRRIERLKDQLIATVSHELRTPLTSIRGALDLVLADGATRAERERHLLGMAARNAERLNRLVNDLLDVERIESGAELLRQSACDAGALIGAAVDGVRPVAEQAGRRLRVETAPAPAQVWADADRIVQVLTNLLGNAIKFSLDGGEVTAEARGVGDEVWFSVRDDGRGIPAEKLESVFEPFVQLHAADTRAQRGAGLGLAISRAIVAQHGGRIWAESEGEGCGASFTFVLPRARVE